MSWEDNEMANDIRDFAAYPRGSYELIAIAPDGEYVVDSYHYTVTESWEAADWGSKWFFYPVAAVALNNKIVAAPEGFDYLEGVALSDLPACADELADTLAMFA